MGVIGTSDEIFDSGYFKIIVPIGWMAFYGIDSECRTTQKKVHIYKNAKKETDIFTHVGITICFFEFGKAYGND